MGLYALPQRRHRIQRRVDDARLIERIASLAALAASAAVRIAAVLRIHAGQRQPEIDAELDPDRDHFRLIHRHKRRLDRQRMIEADRERSRERAEELRRGVWKRIAGERPDRDARDFPLRRDHRGLRQQHDVPPVDVDLFVRRVVGRRLAADGPVRGGVDVAHVELERQRRQDVLRERLRRRQLRQPGAFRRFPGESDADIKRQDASGPREVRDQHGAVEAGGAEYGAVDHA